jgi:hypothetical protein
MPEICRFLGIIVSIYYREHNPPHFHAKYASQTASFVIEDLRILEGSLPPRVVSLVVEWALEHKQELLLDWNKAMNKQPLEKIKPLV